MKLKLLLILISMSLLNKLFGQKEPTQDPYWDFDATCHFKPKLDKGEFYKLSGFDFGWFVLEPLSDYGQKGDSEVAQTRCLSYGQKALYYWWYLDGQVSNGGLVQFYFNNYGKYIPTIIKSLEHIGDQEMADLVKQADKIFQKHKKAVEKEMKEDMFSDELYEKLDALSELDDDYYDLNDQTMGLIEKYIRANPTEFCVDETGNDFELNFSGSITTLHPNKNKKDEFEIVNDKINGTFKSYFESGTLKEKVDYKDGVPTGEKWVYNENGTLNSSLTLEADQKRFKREWFHANGQPEKVEYLNQSDKEQVGPYKEWYANGQLKASGNYVGNYDRKGTWLEFYENGNKKLEAEYTDNGRRIHNFWKEDGEQLMKNGTGTYISENKKSFGDNVELNLVEYKDYKRHGKQTSHTNGIISEYDEYKEGRRHGFSRRYYNNGNLKSEKVFENGYEESEKEFDIFENPVVVVSIVCEMEDQWLINRELETADTYPMPMNDKALAQNIKAPLSLFEGYSQDKTLKRRYFVTINEKGTVTNLDFLIADNGALGDEIEANVKALQFKPAMKDGKAVESYLIISHEFVLGEQKN